MKFNANIFNGAKDFYSSYLKAGKYTVRVKKIEESISKKGLPQLKITFFHKPTGTEFTHYANADVESNEVARNWIYTFATACGYTNLSAGLDTQNLIGKPITIEIKPKYSGYNNKVFNQLTLLEHFDPQTPPVNIEYDDEQLRKEEEKKITSNNDTTFSDFGNSFATPTYNTQQSAPTTNNSGAFGSTGYMMPPPNSSFSSGIDLKDDDLPF